MPHKRAEYLLSLVLLLGIFVSMAFISWGKWPDAQIDYGKDLYSIWRVSEGDVLYRDIHHILGPFPIYFYAVLYKIFGARLMVIVAFNLLMVIALAASMFYLILRTTDLLTATVAGAAFLSMFSFSQYTTGGNYNYITPYTHAASAGIILSFCCLVSFMKFLDCGSKRWLFSIGAALGLASLTKVDLFLSILIATALSAALLYVIGKSRLTAAAGHVFIVLLGAAVPLLGFFALFSRHLPPADVLAHFSLQYKLALPGDFSSNRFYTGIIGTDDPAGNMAKLFRSAIWHVVILAATAGVALAVNKLFKVRRTAVTAILGMAMSAIFFVFLSRSPWIDDMLRPLPLFTLGLALFLLLDIARGRHDRELLRRRLPAFMTAIFSFTLLFKMPLNVHVYQYGFVYAMPAYILFVATILHYLPSCLHSRPGAAKSMRMLAAAMLAAIFTLHAEYSSLTYAGKTYPIVSGGDAIIGYAPEVLTRDSTIALALKKIDEIVGTEETLAVIPEGAMINYLSRRKNPTSFLEFTPLFVNLLGEERIIASYSANKPAYILLTSRNFSEHGARFFGRDFGQKIYRWIQNNYARIEILGDPSFSIVMMRRN